MSSLLKLSASCVAFVSLFCFVSSANAQVVVLPHGDYDNNFESYLVAAVALTLLAISARHSYRSGQLDHALAWFARRFRSLSDR